MSKNSTVVIETLDYEKLKLEGGPVTYTKQTDKCCTSKTYQ